jgi:hypothetical protein
LEKTRPIVLKREWAEAEHPHIMKTYDVTEDQYLGNE